MSEKIEFEDIRVGDKIRHVRETEEGGRVTLEFTVETIGSKSVEGEGLTAYDYASMVSSYPKWEFELLERREPEEWIILGIRASNPTRVVMVVDKPATETYVKNKVESLNRIYGTDGNRYWAVKVDASAQS